MDAVLAATDANIVFPFSFCSVTTTMKDPLIPLKKRPFLQAIFPWNTGEEGGL